ncbi:hypothetical protein LAN30_25250, partial [Mycobacterium tuberculosis]|nr:hypothetical protein [Mycobacterium tuberculosis]
MSPRSRTAPTLSERITGLAMATDIAEGRLDAAVVQQARQTLDRAGQRRAPADAAGRVRSRPR